MIFHSSPKKEKKLKFESAIRNLVRLISRTRYRVSPLLDNATFLRPTCLYPRRGKMFVRETSSRHYLEKEKETTRIVSSLSRDNIISPEVRSVLTAKISTICPINLPRLTLTFDPCHPCLVATRGFIKIFREPPALSGRVIHVSRDNGRER